MITTKQEELIQFIYENRANAKYQINQSTDVIKLYEMLSHSNPNREWIDQYLAEARRAYWDLQFNQEQYDD